MALIKPGVAPVCSCPVSRFGVGSSHRSAQQKTQRCGINPLSYFAASKLETFPIKKNKKNQAGFLIDRQTFSEHAAMILSLCDSKKIQGFLTPVIYSNIYCILRNLASHTQVIEKLLKLNTLTEVLVIDKNIIMQALGSGFRDFEDALQNYAAESGKKIDVILTRNVKDYKHSSLAVMTPEQYLKARSVLFLGESEGNSGTQLLQCCNSAAPLLHYSAISLFFSTLHPD